MTNMPASLARVLAPTLWIQFVANASGKAVVNGHALGSLPHIQESWMNYRLLDSAWPSLGWCGHFGSESADGRSFSRSTPVSLCLSNQ